MKKLKTLTFFLLFCGTVFAQNFSVEAKIDFAEIFIGEQCKLMFEIYQRNDIQVVAPIFSDTLIAGIEIVGRTSDTTKNQDNSLVVRQIYTLTSFDSALYYISPFEFAGGGDTIFSQNLSLKVLSVPIDTTQQEIMIFDIKPIERAPFNLELFRKILLWILLIWFLITFVILLLIRYLRKKRKPQEPTKEEIKRSAYEVAVEKFEEIRKEKIWQQGRSKEYFTQVTDVLREYIESRFDVPTFEKTSAEIVDLLQFTKRDFAEQLKSLQKILTLSDLVKFAKYLPDFDEHISALNKAESFVEETKKVENAELKIEN
ncbi:MAG: hypothetical protein LBS50_05700 [Prevotellaceae bacterium]|jgi:predicted membrane protein|nr:hypothetical protein [Prevotellaceae bacterium]